MTITVYVLHHTNSGTPESGEIHSIYASEQSAIKAMETVLNDDYDGVTLDENEQEDFEYMYISEQTMHQ